MHKILARNGDLTVVRSSQGWGVLYPQPSPEAVAAHYCGLDGEYGNESGMEWLVKERTEHLAGSWKPFYDFQRSLLPSPVRPGKPVWNLVDVGAGAGWFVHYWNNTPGDGLNKRGGNAWGIEPSRTARRFGPCEDALYESREAWLGIRRPWLTVDEAPKLAVRFSLVLEHVPDPAGFLREHLDWPGLDTRLVLVIVPNEFNPLQKAVLGRDPLGTFRDISDNHLRHHGRAWFVTRKHLSYFDPPSLRALFREAGLRVVYETATFPMEAALLAGLDYREQFGNPALGRKVHRFRLGFERLFGPMAFKFYKKMYDRWGIGRELVFIGELDKKNKEDMHETS